MKNINEYMNDMPNTEMFKDFPDCLNVLQLQQMLSIGRNRAYELLRTGQIKHKRIGNVYRIPKTSVIEFLLENY